MAVQLKKDVKEELMEQYGLEIAKIDIPQMKKVIKQFPENLQKVTVLLKQPENRYEDSRSDKTNRN